MFFLLSSQCGCAIAHLTIDVNTPTEKVHVLPYFLIKLLVLCTITTITVTIIILLAPMPFVKEVLHVRAGKLCFSCRSLTKGSSLNSVGGRHDDI